MAARSATQGRERKGRGGRRRRRRGGTPLRRRLVRDACLHLRLSSVADPERALAEVKRVLVPGGRLLMIGARPSALAAGTLGPEPAGAVLGRGGLRPPPDRDTVGLARAAGLTGEGRGTCSAGWSQPPRSCAWCRGTKSAATVTAPRRGGAPRAERAPRETAHAAGVPRGRRRRAAGAAPLAAAVHATHRPVAWRAPRRSTRRRASPSPTRRRCPSSAGRRASSPAPSVRSHDVTVAGVRVRLLTYNGLFPARSSR